MRAAGNLAAWYRSTLVLGLAGSVLLWAALPPLAWGFLGGSRPCRGWCWFGARICTGRRPYVALWFAWTSSFGCSAIQWVRLPHPAVYLGWFALSAYLAVLLAGVRRVCRAWPCIGFACRCGWLRRSCGPAWSWPVHTSVTGFLMGSLAHTQVQLHAADSD